MDTLSFTKTCVVLVKTKVDDASIRRKLKILNWTVLKVCMKIKFVWLFIRNIKRTKKKWKNLWN